MRVLHLCSRFKKEETKNYSNYNNMFVVYICDVIILCVCVRVGVCGCEWMWVYECVRMFGCNYLFVCEC